MQFEIFKAILCSLIISYSLYKKIRVEWFFSCFAIIAISYYYPIFEIYLYFISFFAILNLMIFAVYKLEMVDVISSVLETHKNEAIEQLKSLSIFKIIIFILIQIIFFKLVSSIKLNIGCNVSIYMFVTAFIISIFYPIRRKKLDLVSFFNNYRFCGVDFCFNVYCRYKNYLAEKKKINLKLHSYKNYKWPELRIEEKQRKEVYVLVLGESVRTDYMGLYNQEYLSTPFLSSVNKKYWTNFISPGLNTIEAIPRLLSKNDGCTVEFEQNAISLAKSLGFETYWLSNQGKYGEYETAITQYSFFCDNSFFSNLTGSSDSNIYDSILLPELKKSLDNPGKKFIVLHLMGSHPSFKQRIKNKPKFDLNSKHLNCYLQSILETDLLLNNIYKTLKESTSNFSMLYLSDHGLAHTKDKKSLLHGNVKECANVPLIRIDDDYETSKCSSRFVSGLDFIDFIKDWLNYGNNENYYKPKDMIEVFGSNKLIKYDNLDSELKI